MKLNDNRKSNIILGIIIFFQLLVLIYYMNIRTNVFVDEVLSFGLANSQKGAFLYPTGFGNDVINFFYNHWQSGEKFYNYVVLSKENRFSWKNVYNNQTKDVHPPLYYLILHFICSLFPEKFSLWNGQIINIVIFIFTQIFLYKFALLFFRNNEKKSLLAVCFYGFCMGAINTNLLIRMYGILAFFCVLSSYFIVNLNEKSDLDLKDSIILFFIGFLGFSLHYHFILFYFCLGLAFAIACIVQKKYNMVLKWMAVSCLIFGAFWCFFPHWTHQIHLLGSNLNNRIKLIDYFSISNFGVYLSYIFNYLLGLNIEYGYEITMKLSRYIDFFIKISAILVVVGVALIAYRVLKGGKLNTSKVILVCSVLFYMIILSNYSSQKRDGIYIGKFIFDILPMISFFILWSFDFLLHKGISNRGLANILIIMLMVCFCINSHYQSLMEWCPKELPYFEEVCEFLKARDVIWICDKNVPELQIEGMSHIFRLTRKVFPVRARDEKILLETLRNYPKSEKCILYLPQSLDGEHLLDSMKNIGFKVSPLFDEQIHNIAYTVAEIAFD